MSVSQKSGEFIFALDIGTRSVIGIVGHMEGKNFHVIAEQFMEHEGRSMFDGQIHDIPMVAEVVARVKAGLEQKTGLPLNKVAVAAAGRSLKTVKCLVETEHDANIEIDLLDIRRLELAGLRQAHRDLEADNINDYYCVGHCVLTYLLDDLPVTNLIGHRGFKIGAEIVATFLPVSVVNSLYAVLHRVSLEPVNLTLEPIAAIDAAIPQSFRLLNLALVDIGAGTSDIAITKDGSIIAYGMVPMAGDEITEPIVERFLVEFSEAERIKRQAANQEEMVSYSDIIGVRGSVTRQDLLDVMEPALDKLADAISSNILDLNSGVPPKSVFCVGGGAQVPLLVDKLADRLKLERERVVIRDRNSLRGVTFKENDFLTGPEGVTVVGIATVALTRLGYEFFTVKINGSEYKLFNSRDINVSHALGLISFDPRQLICKNGQNITVKINGKNHTVFGGLGRPARIYINNKEANLQSQVKDGDDILVLKAVDGSDASARALHFLRGNAALRFRLNGVEKQWKLAFILNGEEVAPETDVKNGDCLEIKDRPTVREIAGELGEEYNGIITINDQNATLTDTVAEGDNIVITPGQPRQIGIKVNVNGEEIIIPKDDVIFVDILNYISIDTTNTGGILVLKRNGDRAQYTDPVVNGDRIDIYWEGKTAVNKKNAGFI